MRRRRGLGSAAAGVALAASLSGCFVARAWSSLFRSTPVEAPVPSFASSPAAGAAFDAIREAWRSPERSTPIELRRKVESFLARWPDDGLAPLAHVFLALLALEQGDGVTADREIAAGARLPPGNTRDLWTVACARRLRLRGQAEAALELLRPLVGKNVDPVTRSVFEQELTLAALATGREYEAVSYMDAWLRANADEDAERVEAKVTALVEKLPQAVLVGALQAMRSQRASFGYGVAIEKILAQRLVTIATTSGDAELARLLLDPDAGTLVVHGTAGAELGELATSKRGLNVVEGRTLGLLLPTESPALRDESADVLRGVMWALGLPKGVRGPGTALRGDAGAAPATPRPPCAPPEYAPPADEPRAADSVHLVTRDDAGTIDRTEGSLDELAGAGAAIVIAGLDPVTSARALKWGESHKMTVIALVPPAGAAGSEFSFVVGEAREAVVEALTSAAPVLASAPVAPVVDASEVADYPAQGGRLGSLTLLPVVSCDMPAVRAGDPRFPLAQWDRDHAAAWLVSGSPRCGRDLLGELAASHARGVVGLTLEAAMVPPRAAGLRVVSASAGVVPEGVVGDARDEELRRFAERLGPVGWWTAMGRDAATLARLALRELPLDSASETEPVAARRVRARDRLATARAPLWSSEAGGWTAGHAISRTVCALDPGR